MYLKSRDRKKSRTNSTCDILSEWGETPAMNLKPANFEKRRTERLSNPQSAVLKFMISICVRRVMPYIWSPEAEKEAEHSLMVALLWTERRNPMHKGVGLLRGSDWSKNERLLVRFWNRIYTYFCMLEVFQRFQDQRQRRPPSMGFSSWCLKEPAIT